MKTHFTFRYKNTSFVVAKLNEPWVEFVRDTVVSTCSITASPCCSNLPFRVIIWTAVNGLHSNGIVVYLLKRRITLIYSFLYLLPKYRFYGRCSGILCFLSTAVLNVFSRFIFFVMELKLIFSDNDFVTLLLLAMM